MQIFLHYIHTSQIMLLSSISSSLNAMAAVLLEDFLRPHIWKDIGPLGATIFSKITGWFNENVFALDVKGMHIPVPGHLCLYVYTCILIYTLKQLCKSAIDFRTSICKNKLP